MYPFDIRSKRKQKLQDKAVQPEFLLLTSDPINTDYMPGRHLSLHYQNRYLAKRRVKRTISRLKREQTR